MTPQPPPPPPRAHSPHDTLTDAPKEKAKKPWSKPTISTIDGVVTTTSGATAQQAENASYSPSTS